MNKSELVDRVAKATGLPKTEVRAVLDTALEEIAEALAAGERISVRGLGTFETRPPAARARSAARRKSMARPRVGPRRGSRDLAAGYSGDPDEEF